jgi:hypothetical protein
MLYDKLIEFLLSGKGGRVFFSLHLCHSQVKYLNGVLVILLPVRTTGKGSVAVWLSVVIFAY